jgi:hypothetical protein
MINFQVAQSESLGRQNEQDKTLDDSLAPAAGLACAAVVLPLTACP